MNFQTNPLMLWVQSSFNFTNYDIKFNLNIGYLSYFAILSLCYCNVAVRWC